MSGAAEIQREAAKFHIFKVCLPGTTTIKWAVTCEQCEKSSHHGWDPTTSAELMVRNLKNKGWVVRKNRLPICPECQKKEPDAMQPQKTISPIGPDAKIARPIYALLEDNFDDLRKSYRSGWSDERIAKDCNASLDLVINIRRTAYGELAENPLITELRDDIALLRMTAEEDFPKIVANIKTSTTALKSSFETALDDLEKRLTEAFEKEAAAFRNNIAKLEARLAALPGVHKKAGG